MAFPSSFLDELRNRISLAQVIGRRVRLIKRGREHSGLCPFHNEKTPSFTVSEDKAFFHCFGCGAHGDVIGFVMRTENLTFPEAVEKLAAEAGLEVPQLNPADRDRAERLSGLGAVMEAAAKWFESQLAGAAGANARRYLEKRGLSPDTIARFRLGYAPASRSALKEAMLARQVAEPLLVEAGLLIKPDDGPTYDRFRDRVIFPIADRRGRVIAFGGRALGDAQPKYLNSPETPLFHKGRSLYNLALAREVARAAGTVVVAEGYMDVIALSQAGIAHAVAPLGTALTEDQMAEVWRIAAEPILCFDGDAAGWRAALAAAERSLPLLQPGRSFRFALLPQGQDPDDLIRSAGAGAMTEVLAGALPLAEILWRKAAQGRELDTPERRAAFRQALLDLAGTIQDAGVRDYYRAHFHDRLEQAFRPRGAQGAGHGATRRPAAAGRPGSLSPTSGGPPLTPPRARTTELLLATVINHPELLEHHADDFAGLEFGGGELDRLKAEILKEAARQRGLDSATLKRHLTAQGYAGSIDRLAGPKAGLLARFARPDAPLAEAETGWKHALARHRNNAVTADLREAEAALAEATTEDNLNRIRALKEQLQSGSEADTERGS